MAGITSDVFDIFQSTPVPLKELSAIAVSLELWRCKVKEYRKNRKLNEFCPSSERISSKTMVPDLPSMILTTIDKYVRRFGISMKSWLKEHHKRIFHFYYDNQNSVLKFFDDFVCDYTGAIDYVRTAQRMMHCVGLDRYEKFAIASTYFFEYHIRGLWPLVSRIEGVSLRRMDFSKSPQWYYWVCCLTNQLDKISTEINDNVEKVMLTQFMPGNRPSIEYFWNRLTTENRMQRAVGIFKQDAPSFFRFILQKFDDQQLNEFLNENDCHELVTGLFKYALYDEEWIRSMWMYVQKVMNVDKFIEVVEGMLQNEARDPHEDIVDNLKNWGDLCCEIWNSASEEWKRTTVVKITSNTSLYHGTLGHLYIVPPAKHLQLLPTFLSCATPEERRRFWNNCWADLIRHIRCDDLSKIMNLCFENQDEIDKFKRNTMANHRYIHKNCTYLLEEGSFDHVNNYVSFLFPEKQPERYFKQLLLQEVFFDRGNIEFGDGMVRGGKRFVEFVDDAYADIDQSTEFKIRFMSSPEIQNILSYFASVVAPEKYIEFMDSFALTEETLLPIKTRIIELYKVTSGVADRSWKTILSWCLIYHEV